MRDASPMSDRIADILRLLDACSPDERRRVFAVLRQQFPIHSLEEKLNTQAEIILEAISRAPDITQRGVRGIIAESVFVTRVIRPLLVQGWREREVMGEHPYDVVLADDEGEVRIQVKMQRLEKQQPKVVRESPDLYVVETQRTRSGKRRNTGAEAEELTRPYRFGDFDILAVSLHPSTGNWEVFRYTVAAWLLARANEPHLLQVFQPVSAGVNDDWTDDLIEAIAWFRSGRTKTIRATGEGVPYQAGLDLSE